jgi:biopolymer transport protein ExbD
LVLLIIFMVITPMLSKGVSVEMVKTVHPIPMQAADKSDAVVVAITRDGNTFLGTTKTAPVDLIQKVKDMIATRLDKTVFVKADSRARYEKGWMRSRICVRRAWTSSVCSPRRWRTR